MASPPSLLRIVDAENLGESTRALEIERVDGLPFASIGGKYLIVNTGATLALGKPAKRAYSLLPVAGTAHRCRLIVKRLCEGPGSNALHAAKVGAELSFSGPWGKLVPAEGLEERALFVATDTGITSALGVAEYAAHAGQRRPLGVLWLRADGETFLDVSAVKVRLERAGARFVSAVIPEVDAPDRVEIARRHIDAYIVESGARVVLAAGDGAVIHPLKQSLTAANAAVEDVRIECFFHNPERKVG